MKNDVESKIKKRINSRGRGTLVFPEDYYGLFQPGSVTVAFSNLHRKQRLLRLAQGIYLFPKIDPELGSLIPPSEEIAMAIARRDKARILPTGVLALNQLGLSAQVPLNVVYLTDGSPRKVNLGKRSILFKKKSPRLLAMKGKVSSLVVVALQELGREKVTDEIRARIKVILQKEEPKKALHDAKLAPAWIGEIIRSLVTPLLDGTPKTTTRKKS